MNASNPFQIPSCYKSVDIQQRRRQRFKNEFIAGVAVMVVLLVGLLIGGCMNEQAGSASSMPKSAALAASPQGHQPFARVGKSTSRLQTDQNATFRSAAPVLDRSASSAAGHPETLYVVKSGDTLSHIARAHGTTVKALKAANGLETDLILVGAKLKIPIT